MLLTKTDHASNSNEIRVQGRPTWAEVQISALENNFRAIRKLLDVSLPTATNGAGNGKRVGILAVVKADAYGHGAVGTAKVFARAGADWFGVTCSAEGAELRESGIRQPILLLSGFWDGEEQSLIDFGLTPAVTHCSQLPRLERVAQRDAHKMAGPLGFHLKIDSGMNRLGISPESVGCLARTLADCPHLKLTGTFTQFASSEDFESSQTAEQESAFFAALDRMRALRLPPGLLHMANSAATISRPETWLDMVRPGTSLYGFYQNYKPARRRNEAEQKVRLGPALSFKSRIVSLKDVPAGEGVGYNARFRPAKPARIAVLAAGYADGVPRGMSSVGRVIIKGQFASVAGAISMDLTAVDVTEIKDVCVGDIATFYGPEAAGAELSPEVATQDASELARLLGTRTSDVLCMLGKRTPRIFVG